MIEKLEDVLGEKADDVALGNILRNTILEQDLEDIRANPNVQRYVVEQHYIYPRNYNLIQYIMANDGFDYISVEDMSNNVEGLDVEGVADIDEDYDGSILDDSGETFYNDNFRNLNKAREDKAAELLEQGIKPLDFN
ncbi:MAG: hypothetical protein EZS28_052996, partial [Streblomastix strix]